MSLLASLVTFAYFVILLKVMTSNADPQLSISSLKDYFTLQDTVKQSDGFQVAFGYRSNGGTIDFILNAESIVDDVSIEHNLHKCSQEELDSFYPIRESMKADLEDVKINLLCFD